MAKSSALSRVIRLTNKDIYVKENVYIQQAIDSFESHSLTDLVWLLDEDCKTKQTLPWEYRRAYRLRNLTIKQRKDYYKNYSNLLLDIGLKQLHIFQYILDDFLNCIDEYDFKLLDVGTGRGGFLASLQIANLFANGMFYGLDLDMASLLINAKFNEECGNSRYQLICSNDSRLPFDNGSFDIITSFDTFEHVGTYNNQKNLLRECHRCLKPGGTALITFPNRYSLVSPEEHVNVWFLGFVPLRFKNSVSQLISGMPADDIYPISLYKLKKCLRQIRIPNCRIFTRTELSCHKLLRLVSRNKIFKLFAPGYILVFKKDKYLSI